MSDYDPTDFVDNDFQARKASQARTATGTLAQQALTREETESKLAMIHQQLAESSRLKEQQERMRATLEELRRRQIEFHTGRQEMLENLTRGVGLLEEAEFAARREAEQMAKSLVNLREALAKVQAIHEETWTEETCGVELTRALTAIENARMEWNSARLKFTVLSGETPAPKAAAAPAPDEMALAGRSFGQLCKLGLALTWPLAVVALAALAALLVFLLRPYF